MKALFEKRIQIGFISYALPFSAWAPPPGTVVVKGDSGWEIWQ